MPSRSPKPARQRRVLLLWCLLVLVLILATVPAIFERPHFGMALHGTEIAVVDKGGPAARVGLAPGQRIRSVRGTSTNALPFLAEQLYAGSLGRSVPLTIEEAGRSRRSSSRASPVRAASSSRT